MSIIHLFVVHVGEIHPVHLYDLVANLRFGIKTQKQFTAGRYVKTQNFTGVFWSL